MAVRNSKIFIEEKSYEVSELAVNDVSPSYSYGSFSFEKSQSVSLDSVTESSSSTAARVNSFETLPRGIY